MTFDLNIKTNIDAFTRNLSALAYKQLPFATAQACTALAREVSQAEQDSEKRTLDRPKPFTTNAVRVIAARKERMTATVYMMDLTAKYLEPYQFGGTNVLNSKALLKPIAAMGDLDQYGNLPRNFTKKLKGRQDIFVGSVKTKNGMVNGIWQRTAEPGAKHVAVARIDKNGRVRVGKTSKGINTSGRLKLLVKFDNAHPARQFLDWFGVARRTVDKQFNRQFGSALAKAIASAK